MAERKSAAAASRSSRHTAKAAAAGRANLAKGRESTKARREAAKEAGLPTAGERWAMLLDGRLRVVDLDDKEIEKGRVRNADGGFAGRARAMPSHLVTQFMDERIKRERRKIMDLQASATKTAKDILNDPDVKPEAKISLIKALWDRNLGRNPETVKVDLESGWGALVREAFVNREDLDQELSDLTE